MLDLERFGSVRRPSAKLAEDELELAKRYLQGAVHSFCKNNPGQGFALRDLVGGENRDWNETPLQVIYNYYYIEKRRSDTQAKKQAAIDAGWLLKAVLDADKHTYEQFRGGRSKMYRKL